MDNFYKIVFALGALTGIVLFVRLLEKMLNEHHTVTLAAMAGLLLEPVRCDHWQDAAGALAPGDVGGAIVLFVLGNDRGSDGCRGTALRGDNAEATATS